MGDFATTSLQRFILSPQTELRAQAAPARMQAQPTATAAYDFADDFSANAAAAATAMKMPTDGRYIRCSKMTSVIGTMLDSTERVTKNQRMPKAIRRMAAGVQSAKCKSKSAKLFFPSPFCTLHFALCTLLSFPFCTLHFALCTLHW